MIDGTISFAMYFAVLWKFSRVTKIHCKNIHQMALSLITKMEICITNHVLTKMFFKTNIAYDLLTVLVIEYKCCKCLFFSLKNYYLSALLIKLGDYCRLMTTLISIHLKNNTYSAYSIINIFCPTLYVGTFFSDIK